jgi:hypothetical protein
MKLAYDLPIIYGTKPPLYFHEETVWPWIIFCLS